ncbi:MAG: hypothetical protein DSM107014_10750 [Gomphosphaeria aponina SAG 52.96 = DSM 107014]|uniref:UDP-N-acetyl-alpha-D-muramoyl-L-alanyl-L-glutamate epimerase n=1 Tax=Gomphosphaeria aponina SAG 52.96 = DSM 107014 TaxID=1521640 RepID=A0A941JTC7_9CHRO|nr:hypothetical protein [Gomphosphaeria aponina SAG 52.96 = DSM 107014]
MLINHQPSTINYQPSTMINQLRKKHPRLLYQKYNYQIVEQQLRVTFKFFLEPDITFRPAVVIPIDRKLEIKQLENYIFHLGLIELISYWKATCSPEIIIDAGYINQEQIDWLHDLFIYGLGEFYYTNNLDFTAQDFLTITCSTTATTSHNLLPNNKNNGDLILVAGGKDSSVTLEILKESPNRKGTLILNPTRAAIDSIKIAGYQPPLIVKRTIDPLLIELNQAGYLNGHTPFSAYLAFLGTLIADLYGYENVIASNENSADEQNTIFHELQINHQYSKGFRFETRFREYCGKYLTSSVNYFSFLRPLLDLQIAKIFAQFTSHHLSFRSCNVNQKKDSWCRKCPKCAFVYLSLFNFLPYEHTIDIFGEDLYLKPEIQTAFKAVAGIGTHKPFECVGTVEESRLALAMSSQKYQAMNQAIPDIIELANQEISQAHKFLSWQKILNQWSEHHYLPPEHENLLRKNLN